MSSLPSRLVLLRVDIDAAFGSNAGGMEPFGFDINPVTGFERRVVMFHSDGQITFQDMQNDVVRMIVRLVFEVRTVPPDPDIFVSFVFVFFNDYFRSVMHG